MTPLAPAPALYPQSRQQKVSDLFVYSNFAKVAVEEVQAGDICALTGIADIKIGETICAREAPNPLPTIKVSAFAWLACTQHLGLGQLEQPFQSSLPA